MTDATDAERHATREIDDAYLGDGIFDPQTFVIEIEDIKWLGPWREDYEITKAILEYFGHSFRRQSVNLIIGEQIPVVLSQMRDGWIKIDGEKIRSEASGCVEPNGGDGD